MFKKNLVSIIILTWNRKEDTLWTIRKVKQSHYKNIEVIVVDNGSTDGTREEVPEVYPEVKYRYLADNTGIAGYNRGIETASGEFIIFLDSDSYPAPQAIEKMVEVFRAQPDIGAVAFDVRNADLEGMERQEKNIKFDPFSGVEAGSYNGAGVGIRHECIKKAGVLFEPLFLYFNEFDHSFRIWNSGYRIMHFPSIVSYHKASSSGRTSSRAPYFYTRNLLWVIWRFYPLREMTTIVFSFFYYATVFSLSQKTTIYFKAVLDAFLKLPMIFNNRVIVSKETLTKIRLPIKWGFMNYR